MDKILSYSYRVLHQSAVSQIWTSILNVAVTGEAFGESTFLVKSIAEEFIYFFSQATCHSVSFCSGKRGLGYIYIF